MLCVFHSKKRGINHKRDKRDKKKAGAVDIFRTLLESERDVLDAAV